MCSKNDSHGQCRTVRYILSVHKELFIKEELIGKSGHVSISNFKIFITGQLANHTLNNNISPLPRGLSKHNEENWAFMVTNFKMEWSILIDLEDRQRVRL